MTHRKVVPLVSLALAGLAWLAFATRPDAPALAERTLDAWLPRQAEASYRALDLRFEPARAMEVVTVMDRFWRIAVNAGFRASLDYLKAGLAQAGFHDGRTVVAPAPAMWIEEYPDGGNGWELVRAEMTIVKSAAGAVPEAVFDLVID